MISKKTGCEFESLVPSSISKSPSFIRDYSIILSRSEMVGSANPLSSKLGKERGGISTLVLSLGGAINVGLCIIALLALSLLRTL